MCRTGVLECTPVLQAILYHVQDWCPYSTPAMQAWTNVHQWQTALRPTYEIPVPSLLSFSLMEVFLTTVQRDEADASAELTRSIPMLPACFTTRTSRSSRWLYTLGAMALTPLLFPDRRVR